MLLNQFLLLSALLFSIGVYGVIVRRNGVLVLMSSVAGIGSAQTWRSGTSRAAAYCAASETLPGTVAFAKTATAEANSAAEPDDDATSPAEGTPAAQVTAAAEPAAQDPEAHGPATEDSADDDATLPTAVPRRTAGGTASPRRSRTPVSVRTRNTPPGRNTAPRAVGQGTPCWPQSTKAK